ncbi:hypothetical protein EJ06DRAFT_84773 [Trichodelitschia bisporula]|uniref:Uncharacterized protein n=1 Tax=Trichodelitschia bisporula TaxID=703511 RepID=A0A6G1HRV0_9PEZI|nr:hypothetical protein EJ06DRAFT_84773 [Trichodelitschia bisporula]
MRMRVRVEALGSTLDFGGVLEECAMRSWCRCVRGRVPGLWGFLWCLCVWGRERGRGMMAVGGGRRTVGGMGLLSVGLSVSLMKSVCRRLACVSTVCICCPCSSRCQYQRTSSGATLKQRAN